MHAAHAGERLQRSDHLDRDGDPLGLAVGRLLHALHDLGTERHPGDLREPVGLLPRAQDEDAGDDGDLTRIGPTQLREPLTERREVEARLRLEERGAGLDLLDGLRDVGGHGLRKGRRGRADEVRGRVPDLVAGDEPSVTHPGRHLHQAHTIEILHVHGIRMVALFWIVAAHEHEVLEAERGRAEHVGLERDPVPVAAGHLHDRLDAGLAYEDRGGDRGHRRDRAVAVGHVHGVDRPLERARAPADHLRAGALGRIELRRNDEFARLEECREPAQRKRPLLSYERSPSSVTPLIFPFRDGLGTAAGLRRLPRLRRAVPSASLDERFAYEVSTDASTYTSRLPWPIGSSTGRCAPSATIFPPIRRYLEVAARRRTPARWAPRSPRWSRG